MKALAAQNKDKFFHENSGLYSIKLKCNGQEVEMQLSRPNHVIERQGDVVYFHHNDEVSMIRSWVAANAIEGTPVTYGLGDGLFPYYIGLHKDCIESISYKG